MARYRLGVDIGGTFTDFTLIDDETGTIRVGKCLTTPAEPSDGVLFGLRRLLADNDVAPQDLAVIIHGTTLVTNALIERKGTPVGLLTTEGFRDLLEIGREWRYDIYYLRHQAPEPLVPRRRRRGIRERTDKNGTIRQPVDRDHVDETVRSLVADGVESIAICFLHSFINPANEAAAKAAIEKAFPELSVSISSEVVPEIREYERTSTTVIDAYVKPLTARYVQNVEDRLAGLGFRGAFYLMLSNGGVTDAGNARRQPIRLLESGPAGGCMAATHYSETCGEPNVLGLDMGGTTAKAFLIEGGLPITTTSFEVARVHRFKRGSGLPVMIPVIDMIESGAGGGSIARVDSLGLLKVGPDSAGADPGPACYGRGGTLPTVTDADLILGYLDPDYFLGGEMPLYRDRAEQALRTLAGPLGLDVVGVAHGIHRVVNENMANAARIHALEKGKDPRQFALLAFGGAGPVHARQVAKLLRSKCLIVPSGAGVASSYGFLIAPMAVDLGRSYPTALATADWTAINNLLTALEEQGREVLARAGIPIAVIEYERSADMRYAGQGRELTVPIPSGVLGPEHLVEISRIFDEQYFRAFGRSLRTPPPLEVISWRVVTRGPKPRLARPEPVTGAGRSAEPIARRPVFFEEAGGFRPTPVYDRPRLVAGVTINGPAILQERESTLVVGPGESVAIDDHGNAIVQLATATLPLAV